MNWYVSSLKNYVGFQGRARRKEYWNFVLFNLLVSLVVALVDTVLDTGVLLPLYSLAVLLPSVAVSARRLHDTGRSGLWLLISLVPLVGGIVLLVFMLSDTTPGTNQYGSSPKEAVAAFPPAVA